MKKDKLQKGLSLIELMVALAIGMILLLALASLMSVANRSALQRTTSELLDETARQVFSRLEADLYQAGYVDAFQNEQSISAMLNVANLEVAARYARQVNNIPDITQATSLGRLTGGRIIPIIGCNQNFVGDNLNNPRDNCVDVAPTNRQAIQISYQAVRNERSQNYSLISNSNQEQLSSSGSAQTCNGQLATAANPIVSNRYNIDQNIGNYSSLICDSSVSSFNEAEPQQTRVQPIVLGVEQIVFRYLVTAIDNANMGERPDLITTPSGRSVLQYLSANQVNALPLGWASVVGVEVCVVLAAEALEGAREGVIPEVQPMLPNCLRAAGGAAAANAAWEADIIRPVGDTRLYRRYVRTITIPNSLYL